jgi:hypothetical protein
MLPALTHRVAAMLPVLLLAPLSWGAEKDLFEKGASLEGTRVFSDGAKQKWELSVSERKDISFKGQITLYSPKGKPALFEVSGTATVTDHGPVKFKTEKVGFSLQEFESELAGGEVALTFTGINPSNKPIKGKATLHPKQ